jgi:hypothetical protein
MSELKYIYGGLGVQLDTDDLPLIEPYSWHGHVGSRITYAKAHVPGSRPDRCIYMHRLILGVPDGVQVDHINGDGLDNRRSNLRPCDGAQNSHNSRKYRGSYLGKPTTSRYKGVSWFDRDKNWRTQISVNGRNTHVGYFDTEVEAALAYNRKEIETFGGFARCNNVEVPNA